MKITVTLDIKERYDTIVTNEISLELPGKDLKKGAEMVKEHVTGFVQDACDVLIPQTVADLDDKIASLSISADPAERNEHCPDDSVPELANPLS